MLAGRVAVVTGGSRGIGLAVADALGGAGAHVVRLSRTLPVMEAAGRSDITCDITDSARVAQVAEAILARHGPPDILVNSAGAFLLKPLVDTSPEEFAGQLAVNLTGAFAVLHAFVRPMMTRGTGLVITVGSIADHTVLPGNATYSAAKFGLRGLHGVMAAELAGSGVRASLIAPGPVDTALWDDVDPDTRPGFTPRAAMLRAEDVAEAALFVASRPVHVTIPELHIEPRR